MHLNLGIGMLSLSLRGDSEARVVRIVNDRGANVWIDGVCVCGDAESWRALAKLATEAADIEADCERVRAAKEAG